MVHDTPQETRWRTAFRSLLRETPTEYTSLHRQLVAMREVFYQELGLALEQPLQRQLKGHPANTIHEKEAVADLLDEQLSGLGLSIICPRTGRPAKLVAEPDDGDLPRPGHFSIVIRNDAGKPTRTVRILRRVPDLELIRSDIATAHGNQSKRRRDAGREGI